jgi:predicted ATPase
VAALVDFITDPGVRLVTIVGPGGMGKTRLALALAEKQLGNFAHGVFFVPLAPLDSAEDIMSGVARALGFNFYEDTEPHQQLLGYLRGKSMLLLLDNFEHLLDGASLAADIVQVAPDIQVIVTSREPLRISDEQLFPIQGLDFPDWETPEDAARYAAARLFLQSARRSRPEFELNQKDLQPLTRICRLVQGMPLGIVLAAAWIELLSPAEIAEELEQSIDILETDLRDVPERQRSMRAVFDYTWRHLNLRERVLIQQLSVFRGGCTVKAIKKLTGASLIELRNLTSKSLLYAKPGGHNEMHELLRGYAAAKLGRDPEAVFQAHQLHCSYYLEALAERKTELYSSRYQVAMADIDDELENIRAAWSWAATHGQVEQLFRAVTSLFQYYVWRRQDQALFKDAQSVVEHLSGNVTEKGRLLSAWVLAYQGWYLQDEEDRKLLEQSLAILQADEFKELDMREVYAFALVRMGEVSSHFDPNKARPLFEQSLVLTREISDRIGEAVALLGISRLLFYDGELEASSQYCEESAAIREEIGNPIELTTSLSRLAIIAAYQNKREEAEQLARRVYAILLEMKDAAAIAQALQGLSIILTWIGLFEEAYERREESLAISIELGEIWEFSDYMFLAIFNLVLGRYEVAESLARKCLAYYPPDTYRLIIGRLHNVLGQVALAKANYEEAVQEMQESVTAYGSLTFGWEIGRAMSSLSLALQGKGDMDAARQRLVKALQITTKTRSFFVSAPVLPAAAMLLAELGESVRAIELYELARTQPFVANSQWYDDVAGKHIDALDANLPPGVAEAARSRGRELDPAVTAAELLDYFSDEL